ncbi:unnamed protein product [Eretmochelys imbricata]
MGRIPHRPGGPWTGIFLAASILGSCLQPAPAQTPTPVTIVLTPPSPAVGGGVSLAPPNPPQDFTSCSWYRSPTADGNSQILTYNPGPPPIQTNGSAHTGRETAEPGCSLHIAGLTLNDTGSYTVQIQSQTSPVLTTVHLPVSASVLGSCLQPAPAQTPVTIVLTPPSPAVGGGVSLAPQNPPQDFVSCIWYRSATTDASSRILTYYPGPPPVQTNDSAHTGRETAGPGCALHIAGLRLNDTGSYTVDIQSPTSPGLTTTVHLPVSASVLGSCLQPVPAQTPVTIVLTPPSPAVGGGVSLAPQNPPQDLVVCSWYRSATTDASSRILTYYPGPAPVQNNDLAHTGRETAGPDCALHIAGLRLSDTGKYTVDIQSRTSPGLGTVHLPISASVLGSCLQPAPAQTPLTIVLTPPSPAVGGGVSLAPQNPPQDFTSCIWYRSATTDASSRILTYYPGTPPVQTNDSAHTGRETAGPDCALHIAGLRLNDTGSYTVDIQSPTSPGLRRVHLPVSASVLGSCLQPARAQTPVTIVLTPPSPAVGGGVSLALQPAPQDLLSCSWYRSATTDPSSRILTYIPGPPPVQTNDSAHTGRETAGPDCALHIAGLRLNDTGSYTVDIQSPTSPGLTTTVHLPITASVLGSCLQPAPAQTPVTIVLTPPSPAVGGGVSLAPQNPPQDFTSCIWYRSATTDPSSRILTYYPGPPPVQTNDSAHTGRETAGPDCALHIAGLRLNDTGSYTVDIQSPTSPGLTTTVHLPVSASVLGSCLQPAPAQTPVTIVLTPPSPAVGGGVSLAPQNPPQDFVSCIWYRSATTDGSSRILTYYPGTPPVQTNDSAHTGRETAGPGCALHIAGLRLNDTGSYTVDIQSPTSPGLGTVHLPVSAPVAPRPGLSAGAVAGIVIGSLAGVALFGVGAYFLYSRSRNETPKETGAPVLVYENLPPKAGAGPVAQPGSPPDPSPTYQTLQPRQRDVYEELKK